MKFNDLQATIEIVKEKLKDCSYFYIANDPERALGLETIIPNFNVVHIDKTHYRDYFKTNNINFLCLDDFQPGMYRSSLKAINANEFLEYYKQNLLAKSYIQTFKISPAFENKVSELNATLVNTPGKLNRLFENKLSQFNQLKTLAINLPKTNIIKLEDIIFEEAVANYGQSFVIQFDRSHTGAGTFFIKNNSDLENLKQSFPQRLVRIAEYIKGQAYTLNAAVTDRGTFMGGLSYQITGVKELTDKLGGTVGNDFNQRLLFKDNTTAVIIKDVNEIGKLMLSAGYKGMFGVDLIIDEQGKPYIIEVNARQPASIPMYTKIQLNQGIIPLALIHVCEFLNIDLQLDPEEYNEICLQPVNYSQVFLRAKSDLQVNSSIDTGIYRLQSDNTAEKIKASGDKRQIIFLDEAKDKPLIFQNKAYTVEGLHTNEILLLTQMQERQIKHGYELGRLQLTQSATDLNGVLFPWIIETLQAVENYLK